MLFIVYICAALKNQQLTNLLQKTGELFKKYGVKSYTMDDVAKELGMSKKTIYQFVENNYRFDFMLAMITKNIKSGVAQGVYRPDLDADVIAKIYIANIDVLINQDIFPSKKYVFIDTYKEYLNYHLRGIVSEKGLKYLEQHNLFKGWTT